MKREITMTITNEPPSAERAASNVDPPRLPKGLLKPLLKPVIWLAWLAGVAGIVILILVVAFIPTGGP
jgi:hypothetical protein